MFWRLGFTSAWRNLARSMLAVVSMALAAGFLTNAISFSRGYASLLKADYRSIIGGEIVVYAPQLSSAAPDNDSLWLYQELPDMQNTDLAYFYPELLHKGYLTTLGNVVPLDERRQQEIAASPGVTGVYPRYHIPAYTQGDSAIWATPLRGRDFQLDQQQVKHPAELVHDGRWFTEEDEGEFVAVVSSRQRYPLSQRMTAVGDTLRVMVPRVMEQNGEISYDLNTAQIIEVKVIGVFDLYTRAVDYGTKNKVFYAQLDEIQLPMETWQKIWKISGGENYVPQQISVMTEDMSYLEDVVTTLQGRFPEHSFIGVPQHVQQAEARMLVENPQSMLLETNLRDRAMNLEVATQSGMAMDLRLPLSILIFVNAALVIASNLLIMVNERRTEIGILKAVGATRIQVVIMVLSEALLISLLGALAGFLLFRVPALLNQVTNGVATAQVLSSLASDLLVVFGATTIASLLFGMLPALTMARLSVREVLQTE